MLSRKGFTPGVDYNEFKMIQKDLPKSLKMKVMTCEYEGELVCGAVCSAIGNTGIYLLGATGDKGMKLNGSNLLHWHIIQWLKKQGYHWYDLGGINLNRNPGVYHFKAGIAGKSGKEYSHIGQFEISYNVLNSILVRLGDILRKKIQKNAKKLLL